MCRERQLYPGVLVSSAARSRAVSGAANSHRWVVLQTPWWECLAAGLPFLVEPGDTWAIEPAAAYRPRLGDVVLNPLRSRDLWPVFADHADWVIMFEAENMLDPLSYWRGVSSELRSQCPALRWWNYSAANARVHGDHVRPLRQIHAFPARPARQRPIDVLFVGSLNDRRSELLSRLRAAGVRVYCPKAPVFGAELAWLESCSRLLLNVHHYMPGVWESFRCVPALHRGTPVISESSTDGEGDEWCATAPYSDLFDEIRAALSHPQG